MPDQMIQEFRDRAERAIAPPTPVCCSSAAVHCAAAAR